MTPDVLPVVVRADQVAGAVQGQWTYSQYAAIPDDGNKYEIIDGVLYMSPAPNIAHQRSAKRFVTRLSLYVDDAGIGEVFMAPCDVELALNVVVQPDVLVILNRSKHFITASRIIGTPDLVIEIASPSTSGYDQRAKQDTYAWAGVSEYWVANPDAQTVEVLVLEQGSYRSLGLYQGQATLPSQVIPGLPVPVQQFFV